MCECIGKFFKCLIYIVCLPALLIISLAGLIIWAPIALLGCLCPCCCICTEILECAEAILENVVKLPFHMLMWVGDKCGGGGDAAYVV